MKWVTWEEIGVDRMASAWLIRRFIDPSAKFLFVQQGTTPLPADAEPFDVPGVRLTHRRGHCTFHTILREYNLKDPILQRIAAIVDEADIIQDAAVEPAAPGLDLICRGLRTISPDDHAALLLGFQLYDALYAQLKKEMNL